MLDNFQFCTPIEAIPSNETTVAMDFLGYYTVVNTEGCMGLASK